MNLYNTSSFAYLLARHILLQIQAGETHKVSYFYVCSYYNISIYKKILYHILYMI